MAKRQWLKTAEFFRLTDKQDYIVQVYKNDVVVKRPSIATKKSPGVRSDIFQFSQASARRLSFVCRNSGHKIKSQICLTFHEKCPNDGLVLKNMLNTLLVNIRNSYPSIDYLWCLEFQVRGFPHFHLFTSIDSGDSEFQGVVAEAWLRIIGESDNAKCRWWHNRAENFFSWDMGNGTYLIKEYITKTKQKDVPDFFRNVGRFWGCSRSMKPVAILITKGGDDEKTNTDDLPSGGSASGEASSGQLENQPAGTGGGSGTCRREVRIPSDLVVKTVRICRKLAERRLDNFKKLLFERDRIFNFFTERGYCKQSASAMARKKDLSSVFGEKRVAKSIQIGFRNTNMNLWFMANHFERVLQWLGGERWRISDYGSQVW